MPPVPALKVPTACHLDSVLHVVPMLIVLPQMVTFGEVMEVKLQDKQSVILLLVFVDLLVPETLELQEPTHVHLPLLIAMPVDFAPLARPVLTAL